jgi:hypothetical protein
MESNEKNSNTLLNLRNTKPTSSSNKTTETLFPVYKASKKVAKQKLQIRREIETEKIIMY